MRKIAFLLIFSLISVPPLTGYCKDKSKSNQEKWISRIAKGEEPACYLFAFPEESRGNFSRRGKPYFIVTISRGSEPLEEINVGAGYFYRPKSITNLSIEGYKDFSLLNKNKLAWAKNSAEDKKIIRGLKHSNKFTVTGTSTKGTVSVDTYSLIGFKQSYDRIKKLCNAS